MVRLFHSGGNVVATATTGSIDLDGDGFIDPYDERGRYRFIGVAPGTYRVESDAFPFTRTLTVPAFGTAAADFLQAVDFADVEGFVFADADRDGARDAGEAGLAATLFLDAPSDGAAVGDGVAGTYDKSFAYRGVQNFEPSQTLVDVRGVVGEVQSFTVGLDLTVRDTADAPVRVRASLFSNTGDDVRLIDLTFDPDLPGRFNVTLADDATDAPPSGGDAEASGTLKPVDALTALLMGDPTGQWRVEFEISDPDAVQINAWTLNLTMLEPTVATAGGAYVFDDVQNGLFRVGQVPIPGLELTLPGGDAGDGTYLLRTLPGRLFTGIDFGNAAAMPGAAFVGAGVVYNGSKFDGNDPALNAADLAAIAPDKAPLLAGQTATFANVSGYARGLNAIAVDLAGLSRPLGLGDFGFRVGNVDDAAAWADAPAPTALTLLAGAGVGGADRYLIGWDDRAIRSQWLEVSLAAGTAGLGADVAFYFGSAPGDTGDGNTPQRFLVSPADATAVRNNTRGIFDPAGIDFPFDLGLAANVVNGGATTVNLAAPDRAGPAGATTPTGRNFEGVFGSRAAANTLIGNAAGNLLVGGAASDTLIAGGGDDNTLVGQAGDDALFGATGRDILLGGDGDDSLFAGGGRDILVGGRGADSVRQSFLFGSDADDDILVDGTTVYGETLNALTNVLALDAPLVVSARQALALIHGLWARTDLSFDQRRAAVGAGVGPDGVGFNAATVTADADLDSLFGEGGRDWFFRGASDEDDAVADEDFVEVL